MPCSLEKAKKPFPSPYLTDIKDKITQVQTRGHRRPSRNSIRTARKITLIKIESVDYSYRINQV